LKTAEDRMKNSAANKLLRIQLNYQIGGQSMGYKKLAMTEKKK